MTRLLLRRGLQLGSCGLFAIAAAFSEIRLASEAGLEWNLCNGNESVCIPATVPGNVHVDLIAVGVISDPLYGYQELRSRWVAVDKWEYSVRFDTHTPDETVNVGPAFLVFDGVDTVADIRLNGHVLASVHSMHLQHVLAVDGLLRPRDNELRVLVKSALAYGKAAEDAYPYPVRRNVHLGSLPHRQFVRKTQSDFGWDWGPALLPMGIHGDVRLIQLDRSRADVWVRNVRVHQRLIPAEGHLAAWAEITVEADVVCADATGDLPAIQACLTGTGCASSRPQPISPGNQYDSGALAPRHTATIQLRLARPRLWYPVGHGSQPLYRLTVGALVAPSNQVTRLVGIRAVELVQEPLDNGNGSSFYFRINGIPVFAKGANVIPLDPFPARATPKVMRQLLDDAVAANMNMVRVWGGGLYQPDMFYDMCDRRGLLVWQEFMFACSFYPRNDAFLDLVRREVAWQVSRLHTHPSIVIWGGNNENEDMLSWKEATGLRDTYLVDYAKLYIDTIQPLVQRLDPWRPFVDSSPSNGILSFRPYVKRWGNSNDPARGDRHYYNTADDCMDPATAPRARFFSEFGFQGLPSIESLARVSDPRGLSLYSDWFAFRQRRQDGTGEILRQIGFHFQLPSNATMSPAAHLGRMVYLSQLQQALCYDTWVRQWRRAMSQPTRTMGALYWQLNDVWQAPTWSSIEYGGQWKLLHYFARRFFQPIAVTAFEDASHAQTILNVANDNMHAICGRLAYKIHALSSGLVLQAGEVRGIEVGPGQAADYQVPTTELLGPHPRADCILRVQLVGLRCRSESRRSPIRLRHDEPLAEGEVPRVLANYDMFFAYFKNSSAALGNREHVRVGALSPADESGRRVSVTLSAGEAPALFVYCRAPSYPGHFSDNGFLLLPREERAIVFHSHHKMYLAQEETKEI